MTVKLTGRRGALRIAGRTEDCEELLANISGVGGLGGGPAGSNCCFTAARVKKTNHHIPTPSNVSKKSPMTARIEDIIAGFTAECDGGAGITSDIRPENPLIRINSTEKTIIEMRAQFDSRNKPMLVAMPQIAGRIYIMAAKTRISLKTVGDTGNSPA